MENELRNLEDTFYKIINVVPVSIYWKDKNRVYLGCNKYTLNMAGLDSLSEIVGKKDEDLPWKEIAPLLLEIDNNVILNKQTVEVEETPSLAYNQKRTFFTTKTPLLNEERESIGLIGVSVDVTDLKSAQDKLKAMEHRLKGMVALGANIAHELRTPLASIGMGIRGAERYLPILIDAYSKAQQHNIPVGFIRPKHLETLFTLLDDIKAEVQYSNTVINMLLMNVKQTGLPTEHLKLCSIKECINDSLHRYPFKANESALIKWNDKDDFLFRGDKMLLVHVFFNLIKNALYFIEAENKGEIEIWCTSDDDNNFLNFRDTARGISEEELPKIFEKFYTTNINGTGLGLAFCKQVMESFNGEITCESKYRNFTKFILSFPKYSKEMNDGKK